MLKIIYAGTPEFALAALQLLGSSEHQIVAVYTQPDRPAGRGRKPRQSAVKTCALAQGLRLCQPTDFHGEQALQQLLAWEADLMVVAAYGLLLPRAVLAAPKFGCINIHASLLPRWRGASPIQQAILAGDSNSGVTLMKMDLGLDTGDMIASRAVDIEPHWTSADLQDRLAPLGAELLMETLGDLEFALQNARSQDQALVSLAPRLSKQQAEIDWHKPVAILDREIRAFNPWPVSFTRLERSNLRIWRGAVSAGLSPGQAGRVIAHDKQGLYVSCDDGVLQVTELQFAGKKKWSAAEALNARNLTGTSLG